MKGYIKKYGVTVLIVLAAYMGYAYLTVNGLIDKFVFPTPGKIGAAFASNFYPVMLINMRESFLLLIPSLIIGVGIALLLGIAMGLDKKFRDTLYPIVYAIGVIPALLLSPIALYMAPDFRIASVFLIVYNTIFPTLFATITGIMTIDKRYLDNAATLELNGFKRIRKVILPAAMPAIMGGFVTSLRGSFLILVFAEMYGTQYGMGYFIKKYANFGIYTNVWAGFIFMVVVLILVMQVFDRWQRYMLRWTMDDQK